MPKAIVGQPLYVFITLCYGMNIMDLVAISHMEDVEKSIKTIFRLLKGEIKINNGYNIAINLTMSN